MGADGIVGQLELASEFIDRSAAAAQQGYDPPAGVRKEPFISSRRDH